MICNFNLEEDFGVNRTNAHLKLTALGLSTQEIKNKFASFFGWWTFGGRRTEADFMKHSNVTAAHWTAVWNGHAANFDTSCQSRTNVILPHGILPFTYPMLWCMGTVQGQGTGAFYSNGSTPSTGSIAQGGTNLTIDFDGWLGDPGKPKDLLQSFNVGIPGGSVAYHESAYLDNVRFVGGNGGTPDPKYAANGARVWKIGETTSMGRVFFEGFNGRAIILEGATPINIENLSVFHNKIAGIEALGTWGASINIGVLSGDDNGVMMLVRPGTGQAGSSQVDEAGGNINIGLVKNEWMNKAENAQHLWRGQPIMDIEGQFNVNIGSVWASGAGGRVDALFVVKPYLTTGARQSSLLNVNTIRGNNYEACLQVIDGSNTRHYMSPGNYTAYGFRYNSYGSGIFKSDMPLTKVRSNATQRLGWIKGTGTFDRSTATGKPAYSYTTGISQ